MKTQAGYKIDDEKYRKQCEKYKTIMDKKWVMD
jgi:hypothetical protein